MSALKRLADHPYLCGAETVDVLQVANREKGVPLEWIEPGGMQVGPAFEAYARPLIQGRDAPHLREWGAPPHETPEALLKGLPLCFTAGALCKTTRAFWVKAQAFPLPGRRARTK